MGLIDSHHSVIPVLDVERNIFSYFGGFIIHPGYSFLGAYPKTVIIVQQGENGLRDIGIMPYKISIVVLQQPHPFRRNPEGASLVLRKTSDNRTTQGCPVRESVAFGEIGMCRRAAIQSAILGPDPQTSLVILVDFGYITVREGKLISRIRLIEVTFARI